MRKVFSWDRSEVRRPGDDQATNVGERQVTFEIQHDDARRSVTYSLDGESLRVQLAEQEGAGEPVTQVFVYRRVS
ncbi:MAG: hypothetical protein ABR527_07800 [Gemmatimonadota bacterium]